MHSYNDKNMLSIQAKLSLLVEQVVKETVEWRVEVFLPLLLNPSSFVSSCFHQFFPLNSFYNERVCHAVLHSPVSCWASSESSLRPIQPSEAHSGSPRRSGPQLHSPRQQYPPPAPPPPWAAPELKWRSETEDTAGKLTETLREKNANFKKSI